MKIEIIISITRIYLWSGAFLNAFHVSHRMLRWEIHTA